MKIYPYKKCPKCGSSCYSLIYRGFDDYQIYCGNCLASYNGEEILV